jgi:murein DD-endopeptidase MepM/ murein hydrolase activator NlpD
MEENRSGWHGKVRTAAVLSFGGLIITGCSLAPREPAPVFMLGATSTPARQSVASAPIKRAMIAPGTPARLLEQSTSVGHHAPAGIPLDDPPSARAAGSVAARTPSAGPSVTPSPSPLTVTPRVDEWSASQMAKADPATAALPHGAHFSWPLNGRVLAGYGVGPGGGHNDGINIAAPRGTPIAAIEAGTVAYAGNELRGYGNLILIKHPDGWISAYGHCDELLVKKGDPVYRGKVIAKVGATGNVNEPQLHFELRQGKRPVDPRGFLAAAPVAADSRVVARAAGSGSSAR